ncbi:hypothetical protein PYW08_004602 [Mythimna loreyi]|uniref:Uncharacterized protein n=1 Tax=Mythimna loreyi TaxID=667449 RepID=A0ACC2QRX5_9NEOP|nr:hypothetical protein PYW08_004602 [Mythimna loreyi]
MAPSHFFPWVSYEVTKRHTRERSAAFYMTKYLYPSHCSSYILNVSAIVYAWIGSKSDADSARLIEQIAEEKFNNPWVSLQMNTIVSTRNLQNNVDYICTQTNRDRNY